MFAERILCETFPKETGAARLQQVGLFTLIYMLQGEEVTARRIAELTGQSESQVHKQLQKLLAINLIERKRGRGNTWLLSIKYNSQTKKLTEAIRSASLK